MYFFTNTVNNQMEWLSNNEYNFEAVRSINDMLRYLQLYNVLWQYLWFLLMTKPQILLIILWSVAYIHSQTEGYISVRS